MTILAQLNLYVSHVNIKIKQLYLRKNKWTFKLANQICTVLTSTMTQRNHTLSHHDNQNESEGLGSLQRNIWAYRENTVSHKKFTLCQQ